MIGSKEQVQKQPEVEVEAEDLDQMVAEAEALRAQREYLENELVNKTQQMNSAADSTISSLQVPADLETDVLMHKTSNRALTPSQLLPEDPPNTGAGSSSTSNWR